MSKTLEQDRASHALAIIKDLKHKAENSNDHRDWNDKYASYVKGFPATILMNGLGQAAVSLLAAAAGDKKDPHYKLYLDLQDWLCRKNTQSPYIGVGDLISAITNHNRDYYLRAQVEALAWLQWLKRFAVAYLKKPDGGGN